MLSGYRIMWLMVMFDLPVLTKKNRRDYTRFRNKLLEQGFLCIQLSVYAYPCRSEDVMETIQNKVVEHLPPAGQVRVFQFTDKQWGRTYSFTLSRKREVEKPPPQLTFFDDDDDFPNPEP